jgi:hypothetical protein
MTGRNKTASEHFDLDSLSVDASVGEFTSSTITQEPPGPKPSPNGSEGHRKWHGQIVTDSYHPDIIELNLTHTLLGKTSHNKTLTGYFLITRAHSRGVDIAGSGTLTIT